MASFVYVKNPNGTTYVYQNESYWDKTEQKRNTAASALANFILKRMNSFLTGKIYNNRSGQS